MKMVYASRWLLEALSGAGQSKEALLDLATLLNTISAEDVASYVAMNENLAAFVPKEAIDSTNRPQWNLDDPRLKSVKDAYVRLQVAGKRTVPAEANDADFVLSTDLLGPEALVLQHIVKASDYPTGAFQVEHFAERMLRQIQTFLRFEDLIVLPIARWYMEARQRILTPNRVVE